MKKSIIGVLSLFIISKYEAQTWTKVSGIMDSSQVKGIGVINNQILAAGQNWTNNNVTDYAISNDGGNTWSKLPTYQYAGFLPNTLPQNNLILCSNGFTTTKKLVSNAWQMFAGANNFAEFSNGSIIGSAGSYPDTLYNYSSTGVKGSKLGNYTFKLSAKYCAAANNRVLVFAYGVGLGYIDYSNLGVVNIPATLDGNPMTQSAWDMKIITNVVKSSNGTLFAIGDGLFKSSDNGVNWTTVLYLNGIPISSIALSSNDDIYILIGNADIKKSTDFGVTFSSISGNLPSTSNGAFKKEVFVNSTNEVFVILNKNGGAITGLNSGIFKLTNINGIRRSYKNNLVFKIYPNPSSDIINIELEKLNKNSTTIEITNTLGEIVMQESLKEIQSTIDVSNFKSGIYFITLKSNDERSTQKIIIK